MKILALGDVVGNIGRQILKARLSYLRQEWEIDFIVANGENSAGGVGITSSTLRELFNAGIDCVTGGNHSWKNKEIFDTYENESRVLRPANYPAPAPGRGEYVYTLPDNRKIAILNIQGTVFMESLPCPFVYAQNWVETLDDTIKVRLVDFHGEATSEKKCMGFALDGKISALFGTHTHVQTADAQILPLGSAYITDLGMCGVELSCLGMSAESVLSRYITKRSTAFKRATGVGAINGMLMEIDDNTGLAISVSIVRENTPRTKNLPLTILS